MRAPTNYWKDFWNEQARRSGSDYALNRQTTVRVEKLEQHALAQFLQSVSPQAQDVVLDAGCGSGRNISILSPLVKEVVAVDYSEQMIQRAQERVSAEHLPNVRLATADVTQLQYPSGSFDKVVCASVLQYLDRKNCAQALGEMVRVCKPGGRLVLHIKNGCSLYGLSLTVLRPVARLLGKRMKPEFYRSRGWHERTLARFGGEVLDRDGFGILTFVPLPQGCVGHLLNWELRFPVPKLLKKFAVNCQVTILVKPLRPA